MRTNDIQNELNALYAEKEMTEMMTEAEACKYWNTDSKSEILEIINDEIESYEAMQEESDNSLYEALYEKFEDMRLAM